MSPYNICCNSSGKCGTKKSTPRTTQRLSLQVPTNVGITQFQDLSRQIFASRRHLRPSVANICLVPNIHHHRVVLMLTDDDTSACWSFFCHTYSAVGEACHPESHDKNGPELLINVGTIPVAMKWWYWVKTRCHPISNNSVAAKEKWTESWILIEEFFSTSSCKLFSITFFLRL